VPKEHILKTVFITKDDRGEAADGLSIVVGMMNEGMNDAIYVSMYVRMDNIDINPEGCSS